MLFWQNLLCYRFQFHSVHKCFLYKYFDITENFYLLYQPVSEKLFDQFTDKTEADSERERALIEQWVCLTEERNAVLVPSPGTNIPGAPACWWVAGLADLTSN